MAEGRRFSGSFVSANRARHWLCRVEGRPEGGQNGGWLIELRTLCSLSDAGEIASTAVELRSRFESVVESIAELNRDHNLRERCVRMLPLLLAGTSMETGAVFVIRDDRVAGLLAAYGPTRQRGFPYTDLILGDPVINDLLLRPRIVEVDLRGKIQSALSAVVRRRSGLVVLAPALSGHSVCGLVVLSRASSSSLSLDEADLLAAVCEVLGFAITNDTLSRESRRDAALLNTSQAMVKAVSRSLDLEQTFRDIAVNAALVTGGSHCLLLDYRQESNELVAVASSEADGDALVGLRVAFRGEKSDVLRAVGPRRLMIDDVVFGANVTTNLRRALSMRSALFLPLLAKNELLGALVLYSTGRRERYSEADIARAVEVSEQAAIAIYNARLYRDLGQSRERIQSLLRRIAGIRQSERQKLASVVHDDIVQSIVGAGYRLEAFRDEVPADSRPEFDEIAAILRRSVADARRIIWELRPPVLDELGLSGALKALAQRDDGARRVSIVSSVADVAGMDREVATALYKIAREAMLNARRHASANRIWLSLEERAVAGERLAVLRVVDDGMGFDTSEMGETSHFGCAMMREQAALCGGRVTIRSDELNGTSVEAIVPLGSAEEEADDGGE